MIMAVLNGLIGTQVARQQLHRSVDMAAYETEVEGIRQKPKGQAVMQESIR